VLQPDDELEQVEEVIPVEAHVGAEHVAGDCEGELARGLALLRLRSPGVMA
jgi:hypothetical protein